MVDDLVDNLKKKMWSRTEKLSAGCLSALTSYRLARASTTGSLWSKDGPCTALIVLFLTGQGII